MLHQTLAALLLISHFTMFCSGSNTAEQSPQSLQAWDELDGHFSDPSAKAAVYKHIDDMTFIEVPQRNSTDGKRIKRNAVINPGALWPNGRIPYVFSSTFIASQREVILQAMRHWEDNTCIRFHPRTTETHYIVFMRGIGCSSWVGRLHSVFQPQGVSLGRGCVYFDKVVHELGHVIGFFHEHSRPDRDEYVTIITDNIRDGIESNFFKARPDQRNTLGYGYDYASIMHYRSKAFSKNSSPTIVANGEGIALGLARELSPLDILKTNRLYGCVAGRHPPISTFPQSKKPLTLPEGITCGGVMEGTSGTFYSPGYPDHRTNQKCAWVIRVPKGFNIKLNFPGLKLEQSTGCSKDYIQVFYGRSLDPHNGVYIRDGRNGKFCSLSPMYSTVDIYDDIVTIYYQTDATNFGSSPRGLRIDFSTQDIDECRRFNKCHRCTNLIGSYECQCNDGYYHSPAANTCYDINECAYDNGGCEHTCDNTGGSYRCVCDNGFYLQADGLSCARTPQATRCPTLTSPSNGRVSVSSTTVGGTATYSCSSGYNLAGSRTRTCQSDGTWSGQPPTCQREQQGPTVNFMLGGRMYQNNANVEMNDIGVGDNALLCKTDQTSCCAGARKQGEFYYPDGTAVGWSATNPLFRDRGSQVVRLNRRGNVLSPLGRYRCDIPDSRGVTQSIYINIIAATQCPTLTSPSNGRVSVSSTAVGGTATYSCNSGYSLIGSSTRICQSSGSWSGSAPTCQRNQVLCSSLSSPSNGRVSINTRNVGGTATYSCNSGYSLVGSSTRSCQSSGIWSGSAPTCLRQCSTLSSPSNGRVSINTRNVGGTATYSCSSGYNLVGLTSRTCQSTGIWSGQPPTCQLQGTTVRFMLGGRMYQNNANVEMNDIGVGDNALLCKTDQTSCCRTNKEGEFYYPDGTAVGWSATNPLFRDRSSQVVRLNRRNNVLSPLGRYRCDIPDSRGVTQSIYINIIAGPVTTTPPPVTCGGTLVTSTGAFQTPNWPETYPFNFDCEWIIQLPNSNSAVELTFEGEFGIAGNYTDNCPKDSLKIYDGATLSHTICDLTRPPAIRTTSNNVRLVFHAGTSHGPSHKGFRISYRSISHPPATPPPTAQPTTIATTIATTLATTNPTTQPTTRHPTTAPPITCGGTLTSLSGTFQTPQWPETYPFNFDCQWNFELEQSLPSTNCMLELTFVGAFGIAGKATENCPEDHLKIYEGTRLIHTICDLARPSPISTTTNARLAFHAGPDNGPLRKGFKIMYQTVCPSTPPPTTRPLTTLPPSPNCPVLPTNPQGVFRCGDFIDPTNNISFGPGNFPSGPMTDPVTCNWIVIGRSAARFRVRFKYFDIPSTDECSDNYVAVYDGYGTTTPLLDKICGEKCEQYVTEGTSSIMTVRLVVTSPGPFRGFYAQFEQI